MNGPRDDVRDGDRIQIQRLHEKPGTAWEHGAFTFIKGRAVSDVPHDMGPYRYVVTERAFYHDPAINAVAVVDADEYPALHMARVTIEAFIIQLERGGGRVDEIAAIRVHLANINALIARGRKEIESR